jgi:hypothetical protein
MQIAKHILSGFKESDPNDIRNYVSSNGKETPQELYESLTEAGYTGSNDVLFPDKEVS